MPFHINAVRDGDAAACLVVADWFYEWDQQTKPKQPWRFVQEEEESMVMAGFW